MNFKNKFQDVSVIKYILNGKIMKEASLKLAVFATVCLTECLVVKATHIEKNSDSIMEVELNPPSDIEDKFIEIYQNIYAEDVFICSTDSETDDIILARTDLGNNEYRLTEIVFHEGMAKIRQGVISNRGGCIFSQPKNNVPLDGVLDTISDVSRELRDILGKYNIY